jgi:hypothetical protein
MAINENRRQGRHSLHGGEHHLKYVNSNRIGLRSIQRNLAVGARSAAKRVIVRIALAGILSPTLTTRLLTQFGLVSA